MLEIYGNAVYNDNVKSWERGIFAHMAKAQKTVAPTIHRYSIVDIASGKRENIKDVVLTFYHDGIIELLTIGNDVLSFEKDLITIEKY